MLEHVDKNINVCRRLIIFALTRNVWFTYEAIYIRCPARRGKVFLKIEDTGGRGAKPLADVYVEMFGAHTRMNLNL